MGGSRHGVSVSANRKIWNWYLEELLPEDRIDLVQYNYETRHCPNDHPWLKSSDVLIIIRGDEIKGDINRHESLDCRRWDYTIKKCQHYDVDVVFEYITRDALFSATDFTEEIIKYKQHKVPIESLYRFLPEKLSIETKRKILYLLVQYHLK